MECGPNLRRCRLEPDSLMCADQGLQADRCRNSRSEAPEPATTSAHLLITGPTLMRASCRECVPMRARPTWPQEFRVDAAGFTASDCGTGGPTEPGFGADRATAGKAGRFETPDGNGAAMNRDSSVVPATIERGCVKSGQGVIHHPARFPYPTGRQNALRSLCFQLGGGGPSLSSCLCISRATLTRTWASRPRCLTDTTHAPSAVR